MIVFRLQQNRREGEEGPLCLQCKGGFKQNPMQNHNINKCNSIYQLGSALNMFLFSVTTILEFRLFLTFKPVDSLS